MPIHFRCVSCEKMLSIARRKAGLEVACPKCGKQVKVPAAAGVAVASDPVAAQKLDAMPLFERADFEQLLNPVVKASEKTEPLPNVSSRTLEPLDLPLPKDEVGELQPVDGIVISRSRLTLIAVGIAVLLAISFTVGYFLARATVAK